MNARFTTRLNRIEQHLQRLPQTASDEPQFDILEMPEADQKVFMEWYSAQKDEPGDVDFAPYLEQCSPEGQALMRPSRIMLP